VSAPLVDTNVTGRVVLIPEHFLDKRVFGDTSSQPTLLPRSSGVLHLSAKRPLVAKTSSNPTCGSTISPTESPSNALVIRDLLLSIQFWQLPCSSYWLAYFVQEICKIIHTLSTRLFLWVLDIWFRLGLGITVLMG